MTNGSEKEDPQLRGQDLETARKILDKSRKMISKAAGDDLKLLFKLRRYVYIRLTYDERGSPAHRKALKKKKRNEQDNLCALCKKELPVRGAVLDRFVAEDGYTVENTRLLCDTCDKTVQAERKFR